MNDIEESPEKPALAEINELGKDPNVEKFVDAVKKYLGVPQVMIAKLPELPKTNSPAQQVADDADEELLFAERFRKKFPIVKPDQSQPTTTMNADTPHTELEHLLPECKEGHHWEYRGWRYVSSFLYESSGRYCYIRPGDEKATVTPGCCGRDAHYWEVVPTEKVNPTPYAVIPPPAALQPTRHAYSRSELSDALEDWMVKEFGHLVDIADPAQRDAWYRDSGMIGKFIRDHFPAETP